MLIQITLLLIKCVLYSYYLWSDRCQTDVTVRCCWVSSLMALYLSANHVTRFSLRCFPVLCYSLSVSPHKRTRAGLTIDQTSYTRCQFESLNYFLTALSKLLLWGGWSVAENRSGSLCHCLWGLVDFITVLDESGEKSGARKPTDGMWVSISVAIDYGSGWVWLPDGLSAIRVIYYSSWFI